MAAAPSGHGTGPGHPPGHEPGHEPGHGPRHEPGTSHAKDVARGFARRSAMRTAARMARWKARTLRLREEAERRFPVITELTARMLSVNLLDAGTRLAAQLFLTAVPLLFVVAAFAPQGVRDQLVTTARNVFGLSGASDEQLQQVYNGGDGDLRQTTGVIGALVALLSATACSRAMARVCERAWSLPRASVRVAVWRWVAWIAAWMVALILQGPLRDGIGQGLWLGLPLTFLADVLVWWWTQRLLLGGRVGWVRLLPGAVLTALAMTALSVTARIYMPTALNRSLANYGSLGSVFTMLSWLIALCAVLTFTITAGAVLATEPPLAGLLDRAGSARRRRRERRRNAGQGKGV